MDSRDDFEEAVFRRQFHPIPMPDGFARPKGVMCRRDANDQYEDEEIQQQWEGWRLAYEYLGQPPGVDPLEGQLRVAQSNVSYLKAQIEEMRQKLAQAEQKIADLRAAAARRREAGSGS